MLRGLRRPYQSYPIRLARGAVVHLSALAILTLAGIYATGLAFGLRLAGAASVVPEPVTAGALPRGERSEREGVGPARLPPRAADLGPAQPPNFSPPRSLDAVSPPFRDAAPLLPLPPVGFRPQVHFRLDQPVPMTPFGRQIYAASRRHRLNPTLVAAVVWVESAFDPRALSEKGARGLMQVLPETGRRFGVSAPQLFEPEPNLEAGARYLRSLADRYDELTLVLGAYNAGEAAVDRHGDVPPYPETREYVRRVYSVLAFVEGHPGRAPEAY